MDETTAARQMFRVLINRPDEQISLAEAALCIAWEDQARNAVRESLDALHEIAQLAGPALHNIHEPERQLEALNSVLFEGLGFRGNTWRYNDPVNSYLDQVITTRAGLPITLSIIYIEVGRHLGLPLTGLALPGHFLVQYEGVDLFIDPFGAGRRWSRSECIRQITAAYNSASSQLIEQLMRPPTRRAVLARMLRNLKNAYVDAADWPRALAACERAMLVAPGDPGELRDRSLLQVQVGRVHLGLWGLNRYARDAPRADDLGMVRRRAQQIAEEVVGLS